MDVERVQALVHEGLHELPPQFIRPLNEQPVNSKVVKGLNLPVISLSQPRDVVVNEISAAAKEWGFFAIKDHGVPTSLIRQVQDVGQEFFALPQKEKEKYANDTYKGKFEGYGTKLTRNPDDKLEWIDYFFHLMAPSSKINYDIWPQNPPMYREVTEQYNKEILRLTDEILGHLSEGLGIQHKTLKTNLGDDELEVEMKINMYPPCPQPELALGVEAHTDMSALTILLPNHVPGLQIWKGHTWVEVDYLKDALYVHIGDQIEILSNGKYKSVLHRSLVNKDEARMSWAVFCVPPSDTMIGPLPELVNDHNPAVYSTKTYAQFRHNKINKIPQ
ncbi:hypothetical protein vseg_005880 [Gypsophila vaccaria]